MMTKEDYAASTRARWLLEYTDTFAGEANYSWVKRDHYDTPSGQQTEAQLKRQFKAKMGLAGVPGRWTDYGDMYEFRPSDRCTVLFATFDY